MNVKNTWPVPPGRGTATNLTEEGGESILAQASEVKGMTASTSRSTTTAATSTRSSCRTSGVGQPLAFSNVRWTTSAALAYAWSGY